MGIQWFLVCFSYFLKGERIRAIKRYLQHFNKSVKTNKGLLLVVIYNKKGQNMRKSEKTPVFVFPAGPEQAGLQHLASGSEASGFVSLMVSFLDCAKFQLLQGPELWMTSSSFPSSSSPKNTARPWNTASFSAAPHQSSCWTWSKPKPGRKRSCLVEASPHVGLLEMSSSQKEQKSSLSLPWAFSSALITFFLFFIFFWGGALMWDFSFLFPGGKKIGKTRSKTSWLFLLATDRKQS